MKKQVLFIIFIIVVALSIGMWRENKSKHALAMNSASTQPLLSVGTALPFPQRLPTFQLEDMDGNAFTLDSLKQHWSLLFFGYTNCPKLCPTTLGALNELSSRLSYLPAFQYVFITIDPGNDDKARLNDYLRQPQFKGKSIIGVTGLKDMIFTLSQKLGIHLEEATGISQDIEHSGALLLINPEGKLAAVFTNTEKPHAIAHDIKEIIHNYAVGG